MLVKGQKSMGIGHQAANMLAKAHQQQLLAFSNCTAIGSGTGTGRGRSRVSHPSSRINVKGKPKRYCHGVYKSNAGSPAHLVRIPVRCAHDQLSKAQKLRQLFETPGAHLGPACFDALSAKLIQNAGFKFCFMSGFCVSAAQLALPDVGLISYGEMVYQGSLITGAVSIPVIGDGDNGYGNAMNVKRTVKGYINAGFAGILIEDQVLPKACGHTDGRKVVSREEAIMRIKAAVDARNDSGSDILIIARTDARQAISMTEALWRVQAFADAGADVLFIDALATKEEMHMFCNVSSHVPKMANMLEGGGKTPILTPIELEEIGFKIIIYPLSLLGVSMRAMQDALSGLRNGRIPPPIALPSFDEIKKEIGFNEYYDEEKRYTFNLQSFSETEEKAVVKDDNVVIPTVYESSSFDDTSSPVSNIWSKSLRIKITSGGFEKLDVRIPAGFLEGLTNIIPGVAGMNLKSMLDESLRTMEVDAEKGKKLIEFTDRIGDRIEVFLE